MLGGIPVHVQLEGSIKNLNLSVRSTNALYRAGIKTIKDLLDTPQNSIEKIYGLGVKSLNEIYSIRENLKLIYNHDFEVIEEHLKTFIYNDGLEYIDIKLEDLGLSRRSYNCLKRSKVFYFSELNILSDEDLMKIRNFGISSLREIKDLKEKVELKEYNRNNDKDEDEIKLLDSSDRKFIAEVTRILGLDAYAVFTTILEEYRDQLKEIKESGDADDKYQLLKLLFEIENIKEEFKNLIINIISEEEFGLDEEELPYRIPMELRREKILEQVLNELLNEGKIDFIYDDRLMVKRKSFQESGIKYLSKREYNVLLNRIKGITLETIGEIYDISRERVRQIEVIAKRKLLTSGILFLEDDYKYIYSNYKLDKKDYYLALGSYEVYNFLNLRYVSRANREAEELLGDKKIPVMIRRKFEKAIYKDYITISNKRIKKTRDDLANYVLKTYARNDIHFEEFKKIYLTMVEKLDLEDVGNIGIFNRGYENKLLASNKCLWKYGRMMRYYNQDNYDYEELLKELNLNQYKDVEYSSLKFFRQFPEIMLDYDIRDEYELHNLLKKICSKEDYPNVKFNRMPNIEFGIADRGKQAKDLLYMLAPISNHEFAEEYEKEYGVGANTVLANYVSGLEKYFYQGEYVIDYPKISDNVKNILKEKLSKDLYLMEDVITEVKKIDSDIKSEQLNPRSLKSLGFITYEKYMISDRYDTAAHYFNHILTSEDLVDISKIDTKTRQLVSFSSQLYKLKNEYEIIEYAPNKYINFKRLEGLGIKKETFKDFTNQVINMLGEGKYFTISSIREKGFTHYLDELGFDDWFYTSILIEDKERISYIRVGRNKIMLTSRHEFNFEDFIESIVYSQEDLYIDIYDLERMLKNEYHIFIDIYKLRSIIKSSDMYYDEITEQVYWDYEIYYEVI